MKALADPERCPDELGGIRIEATFTCTSWSALREHISCVEEGEEEGEEKRVMKIICDLAGLSREDAECAEKEFHYKSVTKQEYLALLNRSVHVALYKRTLISGGGGSVDGDAGPTMHQCLADLYNALGYSGFAMTKK